MSTSVFLHKTKIGDTKAHVVSPEFQKIQAARKKSIKTQITAKSGHAAFIFVCLPFWGKTAQILFRFRAFLIIRLSVARKSLPNYQIDSKTRLSAYGKQRQCPLGWGLAQLPPSDTKVLVLFIFLWGLEQFHQFYEFWPHVGSFKKKTSKNLGSPGFFTGHAL